MFYRYSFKIKGKVTKKREKCKRKTNFSFHFRVHGKFGEAKVTKKLNSRVKMCYFVNFLVEIE